MSESDLDDVCRLLKKLPLDDLHELGSLGMHVFQPFTRLTRDQVIGKVRCTLAKIPDRNLRLKWIARVYCFLADKMVLFPWLLYHLGSPGAGTVDFDRFHKRLLSEMQYPGSENAGVKAFNDEVFRSAFCLTGPEPLVEDHDVVCLCAWTGWPYMAIYAPKEACMVRVKKALKEVLPDDPGKLFQGLHYDLSSVYSAILRSSPGDRSASGTKMDQGLKAPQE